MNDNNYIVYIHTNMINGKKYIGITHQMQENIHRQVKDFIGLKLKIKNKKV